MDTNGKNGNGTWKNYVLTIISGLILVAIVGSIIFERDVAKNLGELEVKIEYNAKRIDEKTLSRFTREDFDREMHNRDLERIRIEHRIENLEQQRFNK